MIATVRRLVASRRRPCPPARARGVLGASPSSSASALMATAGYLISRAAEQPAILSLTATIVAVRFFGLARPIARYLERLGSHDVALRASAGSARASTSASSRSRRPSSRRYRRGDLLASFVGDVDALQDLYLRGLGPPLVALVAGAAVRRRRRRAPARRGARPRRRPGRGGRRRAAPGRRGWRGPPRSAMLRRAAS